MNKEVLAKISSELHMSIAISDVVYALYLKAIQSPNEKHHTYRIISKANLKHFLSPHSYFYNHIKDHLYNDIITSPWFDKLKDMEYIMPFKDDNFETNFQNILPKIFKTIEQQIILKIGFDLIVPNIVESHDVDFPTSLTDDYYQWIAKQTLLSSISFEYNDGTITDNNSITFDDTQLLWINHMKALHGIYFTYDDFDNPTDVIKLMQFITSTVKHDDNTFTTGASNKALLFHI